jgi:hypothetical protein
MTQTVQYVVDLKGAQAAQAQMDALDKSMGAGAVSAKNLGVQLDRVESHTGRAAAGTRNLGQAGLEASRAMEDLQYGIGGVVNNIPSLVMALGGSAGLTAVISLAAVGVNQLYKNFTEVPKGAKIAADGSVVSLQDLRKEIDDINLELRSLASGDSIKRLRAMAVAESAKTEAQIAGAAFIEQFGNLTPRQIESQRAMYNASKTARDVVDAYDKALEVGKKATAAQMVYTKTIQAEQLRVLKDQEEVDKKSGKSVKGKVDTSAADAAAKEAQDLADLRYNVYLAGLDTEEKQLRDVAKSRHDDALKAARDLERDKAKDQKSADRARERENKKTLDAIAKAEKKHAEEQAQYATQAVSIVAGASTQLVSDMVSGQEQALERFGLSIMAQAGQALVSYGVQAIGRGVLEASNPITAPLAPASFAAGAGLVSAGVGLGGVAGGVGSLMGNTGGGSDDKRSRRDPGASPRRGGGGGDGGPVVLNLTYGAAGPLPEDTARLISRELRTGAKRAGR